MPSTFFGLEIARRALAVSQLNLQVIAHNIANAGTPGYSRQRAELIATPPLAYPSFSRPGFVQQIGTGVDVEAVKRIRDDFTDELIRNQTSMQGRNATINSALSQIELAFGEPGDSALSASLDSFFSAWQDLANDPELVTSRANLREQSISFIRTVDTLTKSLKDIADNQNTSLELKVNEVNDLAHQIAQLNNLISKVQGLGDSPNDLMDQRDVLVEELSNIVPVTQLVDSNNRTSLLIGGLKLVEEDNVHELSLVNDPKKPMVLDLRIGTQLAPDLQGKGEIAGLLEVRNSIIPYFQNKLNNFISGVVNRVNVQHRLGFGLDGARSRPFFQDFHTSEMIGEIILPVGTNLDTSIDKLGITAGTFTVQGKTLTITQDDVAPGEATTLGEIIKRITSSQPLVRASIVTDQSSQTRIHLDLFNPPDAATEISVQGGTSNFLTVTGLLNAKSNSLIDAANYSNSSTMLDLSFNVRDNLDTIAAAGDDGSGVFSGAGNNVNALAISALQSSTTAISDTTFEDYYTSIIGEVGSQARSSAQMVSNQDLLLNQLMAQRESVMGVNMDEEATAMITFQRIFEGAARVTQVVDSMLDTLINRLGA